MVLESPFYGSRKPHYQFASQLQRVSDLLTLGRSTIEESLCLLNWAGRHAFASLGQWQAFPAKRGPSYRVTPFCQAPAQHVFDINIHSVSGSEMHSKQNQSMVVGTLCLH